MADSLVVVDDDEMIVVSMLSYYHHHQQMMTMNWLTSFVFCLLFYDIIETTNVTHIQIKLLL